MNNLCFNEACTKDFLNLQKDLELADKYHFDYIEMRFDCLNAYLKQGYSLTDLKESFLNLRIKPHAINALYIYPEFLTDNDIPEKREEILYQVNLLENLYKNIGCNKVVVVVPLLADSSLVSSFSRSCIINMCQRFINFLLEKLPMYYFAFEVVGLDRSLVRDLDFGLEIVNSLKSDKVGFTLDSYNLFLENYSDQYDFSKLSLNQIFVVHMMNAIKSPNNESIVDQRYRRLCSDGDLLNLGNFMRALQNKGYKGMISTEVFNPLYAKEYTQEELIKFAYTSLQKEVQKWQIN